MGAILAILEEVQEPAHPPPRQKSASPKEEQSFKMIASWDPEGSMPCLPERIGGG